MHLAPLAGIETNFPDTVVDVFQMHLAPLAGIETSDMVTTTTFSLDASRTPCGD